MYSARTNSIAVVLLLASVVSVCRGARICSHGSSLSPCPVGWDDKGNKICSAPSSYDGPCLSLVRMWDEEFKSDFGIVMGLPVLGLRSCIRMCSQRIGVALIFLVRKPAMRTLGVIFRSCMSRTRVLIFETSFCRRPCPKASFCVPLLCCLRSSVSRVRVQDWDLVDGICEVSGEGYAGEFFGFAVALECAVALSMCVLGPCPSFVDLREFSSADKREWAVGRFGYRIAVLV